MSSIQTLQVTGDLSRCNVVPATSTPAPELGRSAREEGFEVGSARKIAWRALLLIAVVGVCGVCLWLPLVTYNDLPPWEATEIARRRAVADGHPVQEAGSIGQYITETDTFGGCEVEVLFGMPPNGRQDVAVRLRRWSALVSWQVVEVAVREAPE